MGQAKRRGSLKERTQAAIARNAQRPPDHQVVTQRRPRLSAGQFALLASVLALPTADQIKRERFNNG